MTTWRTDEQKSDVMEAELDSNGEATIEATPQAPKAGRIVVDHVALNVDQQTGSDDPNPVALLYLGRAQPENFVDGTADASLNAASYSYGLIIPSGDRLRIKISQGLAGGKAIVRTQYSLQERAA